MAGRLLHITGEKKQEIKAKKLQWWEGKNAYTDCGPGVRAASRPFPGSGGARNFQ